MSKFARLLVSAVLATLFGVVVVPAKAQAGDPSWATCSAQEVPVFLSATNPTKYVVRGRLCLRSDNASRNKTIQLMVAGITYDQNVFNSSLSPNSYSYVFASTSRGYSTFVIDRLGTGTSDKPAPDLLTLQSHAYVIGQITQALHAGTIGVRAFPVVVGVGHSFGSAILQYLAGTSTVAGTVPDYLVLGSFMMTTYAPTQALFASSLYPATSDPKFAGSGLPAGYITTIPGTRDELFLHMPGVETAMPAYEESIKSLATTAERSSIGAARNPAITQAIKVPVIMVVGQYDALFCNEASGLTCADANKLKVREGPNFGVKACFSTYAVIDAGHAYQLHIKARDAYNATNTWVDQYTFSGAKDVNGCVV